MNFQDMMAELQAEYIIGLRAKITELTRLNEAGQFSDVKEIFHKLKGTGATYGIPEISMLGEVLETICDRDNPHVPLVVKDAIEVLETIYTERSAGREFSIVQLPQFHDIKRRLGK